MQFLGIAITKVHTDHSVHFNCHSSLRDPSQEPHKAFGLQIDRWQNWEIWVNSGRELRNIAHLFVHVCVLVRYFSFCMSMTMRAEMINIKVHGRANSWTDTHSSNDLLVLWQTQYFLFININPYSLFFTILLNCVELIVDLLCYVSEKTCRRATIWDTS